MDITSYLGGVSWGQDTSGYFKLFINGSVAVKASDGMYYAYVKDEKDPAQDHLFQTNDFLTFPASSNLLWRFPVAADTIDRGDVVMNSSKSAVFAREKVKNGQLSVLDPEDNTKVDYIQPDNLLNIALNTRLIVKVFSIFSVSGLGIGAPGGITFDNKLFPLLLLLGDRTDDDLATLLLFQALSGGVLGGNTLDINNLLPLLLLGERGGKSDLVETLLLTQALEGQKGHEGGSGA